MYQYTNKNGETFGITHTESSTMAYINGSYVAQAETDRELEEVLDHFSHTDREHPKVCVNLQTDVR